MTWRSEAGLGEQGHGMEEEKVESLWPDEWLEWVVKATEELASLKRTNGWHQYKNRERIEELENEINNWLAKSGVRLVSLTGNIAPQTASGSGMGGALEAFSASDILVIVTYEDGK